MSHNSTSSLLFDLIRQDFAWDAVEIICEKHPEIIELARTSGKGTVLHELCSIGSAPFLLVKKVLRVWEGACFEQNKYGDTPLHAATRSSQISSGKIKLLIDCCPDALVVKNGSGHSPLATAMISGACFPVIQMLVEKDRSILLMKDDHGHTPTELLWASFQKNIPGSLAIKSYLHGRSEMRSILQKFWVKFIYCVMESFRLSRSRSDNTENCMLCHAILDQNLGNIAMHQAIVIALIWNKELAMQTDENGNNTLHSLILMNRFKEIDTVLQLCPCVARQKNKEGRKPLHIALDRHKENGAVEAIRKILDADIDALDCKEPFSNLYPFMISAVFGNLQMTYEFLLERPLAGI